MNVLKCSYLCERMKCNGAIEIKLVTFFSKQHIQAAQSNVNKVTSFYRQ